MIQNTPWVTLQEALTAGNKFPLADETYDFIRDLMDTYQARPIDRKSFSALVNMMLSAYLAGEISGKRKDRARRKGVLHTLTKEQKDEYIRYLQRLVKEDPRQ